jgi:hypothetical protein
MMRSKWFMPLFCLGLGVAVFVPSWLGGHLGDGVFSLAVMAGFGLFLPLVAGRSETVRGLTFGAGADRGRRRAGDSGAGAPRRPGGQVRAAGAARPAAPSLSRPPAGTARPPWPGATIGLAMTFGFSPP